MELVKEAGKMKIFKKRNGRYGVKNEKGQWLNGSDKIEVLSKEGLIQVSVKKAPPAEEPAPAEAVAAEDAQAEDAEPAAEDKPAE